MLGFESDIVRTSRPARLSSHALRIDTASTARKRDSHYGSRLRHTVSPDTRTRSSWSLSIAHLYADDPEFSAVPPDILGNPSSVTISEILSSTGDFKDIGEHKRSLDKSEMDVSGGDHTEDCAIDSESNYRSSLATEVGDNPGQTQSHTTNLETATVVESIRPKLVTVSRPRSKAPFANEKMKSPPVTPDTPQSSVFDQRSPGLSSCTTSSFSLQSVDNKCVPKVRPLPLQLRNMEVSSPIVTTPSSPNFGTRLTRKLTLSIRRLRAKSVATKVPPSPSVESHFLFSPARSEFRIPPPPAPKEETKPIIQKLWDNSWVLDKLEESARDFPERSLTLNSPVIALLRASPEKVLLGSLGEVFDMKPDHRLNALCSAVIASNYLSSLLKGEVLTDSPPRPGQSDNSLDDLPRQARTRAGLRLSKETQLEVKECLMQIRTAEVQQRLVAIVDQLLMVLCGRSDDLLRSSLAVLVKILERHGGAAKFLG